LVAACSAAAPASLAELVTWASAKVSGTVTSHASGFPLAHGRIVVPSGRLPSSPLALSLHKSERASVFTRCYHSDACGAAVLVHFCDKPSRGDLLHRLVCSIHNRVAHMPYSPVCERQRFWLQQLLLLLKIQNASRYYDQSVWSDYYYYYNICIAHKFKHARVGGAGVAELEKGLAGEGK